MRESTYYIGGGLFFLPHLSFLFLLLSCAAFFVHVNTKVRVEEDGGASLMEGLKLDPKKLDKAGGTQVYVIYDKV